MKKKIAFGVKLALTAGILIYLFRQVDWEQLGQEFAKTNLWWYGLALVFTLLGMCLTAIRWRWLLRVQGIALPLRRAFSLTFIGMFFNAFLLGTTGGDLSKLYYITKEAPDRKAKAVLSVVMDRAIGLLALLMLGLVALPFKASVLWQDGDTRNLALLLLVLFVAGVGGLLFLLLTPFHRSPEWIRRYWAKVPGRDVIETLLEGVRQHGRSARLTISAFLLSLVLQFFLILGGWSLAFALQLEIPLITIILILAIVQVAISLPISIGGHGVREGVFFILLLAFGFVDNQTGKEVAIAYSILFFSLQLFCSLVGSVVYFFSRSTPPSATTTSTSVS